MSIKLEIADWNEDRIIEMVDDFDPTTLSQLIHRVRDLGEKGAVVATISKSNKDYIHISYTGRDMFLLQAERMEKVGGFVQRLVQPNAINFEPVGNSEASKVVKSYLESNRYEFESSLS